ncbi:MAG: hypothetical protein AAGA68_21005 [Pseudomonadota bacterium]
MDQLDLLKKVLRLPQHWQVVDVEADEETRQLTVSLHFVRTRRRLLGGETNACARCGQSLAPTPASRYLQLRHLPLGDWQVHLRLPDATAGCADRACPAAAELAEPGTRISHALASRIVALYTGGASFVTTAALLDVEVADVAVVLSARGMPVDALTGEIALVEGLLQEQQDGEGAEVATHAVDALADREAKPPPPRQAQREPESAQASDRKAPSLPPIAASVPAQLLMPSPASGEETARTGDATAIEPVPSSSPPPAIPVPQPVPTNTLLAADEDEAQAVFERAIEGETDALAHASIDEHTQTDVALIDVEAASPKLHQEAGADDSPVEVAAEALEEPTEEIDAAGSAAAAPDRTNAEQASAAAPVAVGQERFAPPTAEHETGASSDASSEERPAQEEGAAAVDGVAAEGRERDVEATPLANADAAVQAVESPEPSAIPVLPARAQVPTLPAVDHPIWVALLSGDLTLETSALALQMLLARLRQFVRSSDDRSAVSAAARVLHKHLGQSAQRYADERAQLLAAASNVTAGTSAPIAEPTGPAPKALPAAHDATVLIDDPSAIPTLQPRAVASAPPPVPPVDDPIWAELVTGERPLDTSSVALKMMLEQIKRSVQSDASDATRLAGVRLLHTFFSKTARQLSSELRQLNEGSTTPQPASEASAAVGAEEESAAVEAVPVVQPRIPPETSASWQALLDGRVVPSQEDPGLSMLLEKVRRVTSQGETSGEVMAAAARVLRRYLARYARRHVDLLADLNSLDLSTTTQQRTSRLSRTWRGGGRRTASAPAGNVDVPPVDDPVWRRLMDGDLLLETDAFALRMMLERIRRSVRRDPSEGNRQAAALQLRDYFVKHERVHRAELQRIRAA